jgi:hypothetical protein
MPKFELVLTDKLVKCSWNYKDNEDETAKKLVNNINRNGQIVSILVRELETGALEIVDGNHRYDAICQLGIKEVTVCNLGKISLTEAKRQAVEINETNFPNDILRLSGLLVDVTKEFGDEALDTLPYTEKELNKLLSAGTWATVKEGKQEREDDLIIVKIPMTFDQHEAWLSFKSLMGTDNDALAFAKAVTAATENLS